jgi:hypothetical protein
MAQHCILTVPCCLFADVAPAPRTAIPAPVAAMRAAAPDAADPQDSANALPFGADRPYGTPVPGGLLIGADIPMELKVRCSLVYHAPLLSRLLTPSCPQLALLNTS